MLQHPAGAGGGHPFGAEVVLDGQGNPRQRGQLFAGSPQGINAIGIGPSPLGGDLEIGVNGGVDRCDPGQMVIGELPGRDVALAQLFTPCCDPLFP